MEHYSKIPTTCRLLCKQRHFLGAMAKKRNCTIAAVIRELIDEAMQREEAKVN